jgi:crotonobetainyl-CoA:carnitine CoA-transferase CaiB-like acyl-CoA transferase
MHPTVPRRRCHDFRVGSTAEFGSGVVTRHHGRVTTTPDDRTPLAGLRVLDLTRVLAGPHCGRMLVDLGADVVKIEPPDGDLTRFSSPRIGSLATYFMQQNAGKRCMSIDLSTTEGQDVLIRLAERSDVLVENYRAGVMDRLGLGSDVLRARNPRLVYASISGYGADGPWVRRRAYATVIGAESGLTHMQGESSGNFVNDPWSHADTYTALETTVAILAALHRRDRTGLGDRVDVSMAETMLYVNEHAHDQLFDRPIDPQWIRSFRPGDYPILSVADGTIVVISGHPAERGTFEIMVRVMDRPHLLDDPRYVDVATRLANFDALRTEMTDWARTVPDAATFEARCAEHGLAVGVVRTVRELAATDWAAARGAIVEVPDRIGGYLRVPGPPWHFENAVVNTMGEPRYRGEDNRGVLREVLGMTDDEIDELERRDVLSSRLPRSH